MLEFPRVNACNTLEPAQNSLWAWMHIWSYNIFLETLPRGRPPRLGSASQTHSDFAPAPHCSPCQALGCRDPTRSLPPSSLVTLGPEVIASAETLLCAKDTVKSRNMVMGHMARNQGNPIKCDALKSPPPIHCTTPESSAQSGSTELGHGSGVWRGLSGTRFRDVACL